MAKCSISVQKVFFIGFCLEAYRQSAKAAPAGESISRDLKDDINNLLNIIDSVSKEAGLSISARRVQEFRVRVRENITNRVFVAQAHVLREILYEELRDFCIMRHKRK